MHAFEVAGAHVAARVLTIMASLTACDTYAGECVKNAHAHLSCTGRKMLGIWGGWGGGGPWGDFGGKRFQNGHGVNGFPNLYHLAYGQVMPDRHVISLPGCPDSVVTGGGGPDFSGGGAAAGLLSSHTRDRFCCFRNQRFSLLVQCL